jgi:glycosyltransferase involved in cell wall biosynthesis
MKVFMLIRFLDYSGAPTMFMWVAEAMRRKGHEVTVCTYNTLQKDIKLSEGIKWIDFTDEHKGFFGTIIKVRKLIKEFSPDVSVSFQLDANVYNILACYGLRTQSVVCERNDPYKPGYWKLKLFKPLFGMADGAVFQLPKARGYYNNVKVPVAIIPNPIVSKTNIRCESYDKRKHIIAAHGRIDIFQKRQDVLIDAFAKIVKEYPDYQLHIYGSQWPGTNDEERLKAQIRQLGLEGKAILMGVSKNPQEDIKDAMVWVSTSDFEGISNALMDAMAIGIPVVATDCSPGGAAFLINNKENGLLVKRGDAQAVYEGIKYMIEHPIEADEMGKKALEIENLLDSDKIERQWEDYLLSLCKA